MNQNSTNKNLVLHFISLIEKGGGKGEREGKGKEEMVGGKEKEGREKEGRKGGRRKKKRKRERGTQGERER